MANPEKGWRYYLIDGDHVPANEVETEEDPYDLLETVGDWPDEPYCTAEE